MTHRKSITVGPLGCQFSNENKAMNLRPHQHYAEVTLTFVTTGALGFPVFADTVHALRGLLRAATARPFRDSTNENVADALFAVFDTIGPHRDAIPGDEDALIFAVGDVDDALTRYGGGGDFRLAALELAVMGVPDDIGHSEGFARYRVEAW